MVDENVHFRHTARLMVSLGRAQRRYDALLFPEERHMPRQARDLEYQERRIVEHFQRHLQSGLRVTHGPDHGRPGPPATRPTGPAEGYS